jgi:hypothetical protein
MSARYRTISAFTTDAISTILTANKDWENAAEWEVTMDFGYFTLSDNHYENNSRTANQFVADITNEALYADKLGMHSAWIGEHHFNSLGVLSCPACAGGDGDSAASPDPRRRAVGDA